MGGYCGYLATMSGIAGKNISINSFSKKNLHLKKLLVTLMVKTAKWRVNYTINAPYIYQGFDKLKFIR